MILILSFNVTLLLIVIAHTVIVGPTPTTNRNAMNIILARLLLRTFERDAHLLLHGARVVHLSGDAEEFGSAIAITTELGEPTASTTTDLRGHSHRLHVGHLKLQELLESERIR